MNCHNKKRNDSKTHYPHGVHKPWCAISESNNQEKAYRTLIHQPVSICLNYSSKKTKGSGPCDAKVSFFLVSLAGQKSLKMRDELKVWWDGVSGRKVEKEVATSPERKKKKGWCVRWSVMCFGPFWCKKGHTRLIIAPKRQFVSIHSSTLHDSWY